MAVTTVEIREAVERLIAAGQWRPGDPEILVALPRTRSGATSPPKP